MNLLCMVLAAKSSVAQPFLQLFCKKNRAEFKPSIKVLLSVGTDKKIEEVIQSTCMSKSENLQSTPTLKGTMEKV